MEHVFLKPKPRQGTKTLSPEEKTGHTWSGVRAIEVEHAVRVLGVGDGCALRAFEPVLYGGLIQCNWLR